MEATTPQLGWHPEESLSYAAKLKNIIKKRGKNIYKRGDWTKTLKEKEIIKKEIESKQPPKETCSEAYHNGPNKTPPAGQEVEPITKPHHGSSDPYIS